MKNILAALAVIAALSGCVAYPVAYGPSVEVAYEPEVVVGLYPLGFYSPGFGYWNGYGWDLNFYAVGHGGYGHYYHGAPGYARGHYRGGHDRGDRGHDRGDHRHH